MTARQFAKRALQEIAAPFLFLLLLIVLFTL